MAKGSSEAVEPGMVLAGRYRVERQLGKGGMGSVFLVQHVNTDQRLALKLLHSAVVEDEVALTRFRREARAPARVNSDHVVQVTDADLAPELDNVPFLVMEWLRGQNLEDMINERGRLTADEVVLYLRHTARALDKAHPLGIIHRDLKPENLFLTTREDGTPCVKILDFGIAKLTQEDEPGRMRATSTGQIFGTPLYMSPEQTKAEMEKISAQTDVWALGIIAHRLLLGREPWTAPTITALIAQIAYEPLPVPSQHGSKLGGDFDAWFARCCAKEPGDRFPSAGEAVTSLARALMVVEDTVVSSIKGPVSSISVRPPRDEATRTAFSATAPAPLSIAVQTSPILLTKPARSGSTGLVVGVVVGVVGLAAAGWMLLMPTRAAVPVAAASAASPPVASPERTSAPPPMVTVTPSAAITVPAVEPTVVPIAPIATASTPKRALDANARPPRPVVPAVPVTAPPPVPVPVVPAVPADPLGTRQ